ncbi:putative manganese transporter [uncultured Parolsenella sp.]|uniref:putative manganese transporter n=1 Tax=uncultured Parolsenella sp. TaxID=2083008 RepID=UPI00265807A5|nr:putative manganese transporter [uncultured Parolsenella sp.]
MDLVIDVLKDALIDTAELVPFLFVTYVAVSLLELFASGRAGDVIQRAGHAGPLFGGLLGLVPQCGFSAMGAMLYADRIVTLGTLVAVVLSTSDEMLPLLVAERLDAGLLFKILATKAVLGVVLGFAVDLVLRATLHRTSLLALPEQGKGQQDGDETSELGEYDVSEYSCDCGCEEPMTRGEVARWIAVNSAYKTAQVTVFIFAVTLVLGAAIELVGIDAIASFFSSNAIVATFASGLFGLIPNCAASVVITQLYLDGALGFAPMMAGVLVAGGAAYLVLFRTNASARENVAIAALMYALGVGAGLVMLAIGF